MSEASEQLKKALNEVNNYQQTVKALLAFAALIVHDGQERRPEADFGFGRRMTTSPENKVTPSEDVTPDLVAQKASDYGIIAEVKKSLPRDQTLWGKYVKQLLKYDDELTGWWTTHEKMPSADAVLLLHHSRSRPFCEFLQKTQTDEPDSVGENTSVVEFCSSDETASYYFFRLEHGSIRDRELLGRLEHSISIPLDDVLQSFPNVRFYDSKPPTAFLITELWMGVFPSMLESAEYDDKYKAIKFPASVCDVTEELQKAFGSESATLSRDDRSVEFPRQRWIKEAFEKLVELKMAIPPTENSDVYQILFKPMRGDVLNRFIQMDLKRKDGDDPSTPTGMDQMSLFSEDEAEE